MKTKSLLLLTLLGFTVDGVACGYGVRRYVEQVAQDAEQAAQYFSTMNTGRLGSKLDSLIYTPNTPPFEGPKKIGSSRMYFVSSRKTTKESAPEQVVVTATTVTKDWTRRFEPGVVCISNTGTITLSEASAKEQAPDSERKKILAEKEAALVAILENYEAKWNAGVVSRDDDEWMKFKIALYTLRRDAAGDIQEKIAQQEKIVQCLADVVKEVEAQHKMGPATSEDILRAKLPLWDARLKLEELKERLRP